MRAHHLSAHYKYDFPIDDADVSVAASASVGASSPGGTSSRRRRSSSGAAAAVAAAAAADDDSSVDNASDSDDDVSIKKDQSSSDDDVDDDDNNDDDHDDNDQDADVDDKVAAVPEPTKVAVPQTTMQQFAKKVGDEWVCCEQHFSETAVRSHFLSTHQARQCPNVQNGCPETLVGSIALQRHIRICNFRTKRGRAPAKVRTGASTAAVKTIYVDSLNRRAPNPLFDKWLPPAKLSVYSNADAAALVDSETSGAESMPIAVARPLNGVPRAADALRPIRVKRFTSVAIDDAGNVMPDDSPANVHEFVLFGGAPIWAAAWLPADAAELVGLDLRDGDQYFALATHDVKSRPWLRPRIPSDDVGRVIQIWRTSKVMPLSGVQARKKPVCSLLLAHRFGAVQELKWYPLVSPPSAAIDSVRLGVFAMVTNDGFLRIVAVPKPPEPRARSTLPPVVDVPVICTITMPAQEAVLCCAWSSDAQCRYLAIGGSMGSVRVYDIVAWHDAGGADAEAFLVAAGRVGVDVAATGISWNPNNGVQTMFAVARSNGSVVTFDLLRAMVPQRTFLVAQRAAALQWLPNELSSGMFVSAGHDGEVNLVMGGTRSRIVDFDMSFVWSVDVSPFFVRHPIAVALQSGGVGVAYADTNRRQRGVPRAVIAGVDFAAANGDVPFNVEELRLWRTQSKKVFDTPEERRLLFLHGARKQATLVTWSRCMSSKDWLLVGGSAGLARLMCITESKLEESPAAAVRAKKAVSARKAKEEK